MFNEPIIGLAFIIVLGIGARWLAWFLHMPAILVLLLAGFMAGPLFGLIKPDLILGKLFVPIVSFSVAIILFEGGLTLKISRLKEIGSVLRNLLSIGVLVTFGLGTAGAWLLLGFSLQLSLLLGAILTVTGPTVVQPMLNYIRPRGASGHLLHWEGILVDPIGASLAVLVFEVLITGELSAGSVGLSVVKTLSASILVGGMGSFILYFIIRKYFVPDFLHNPVVLMLVIAVYTVSDYLYEESGLLAATLMGMVLVNQSKINIRHIIEFKENLRVLLISILFIVLSARIAFADLLNLSWGTVYFLGLLLFVIRPLSVYLSTIGSTLTGREKIFMSWMAPRGIVAAAITSVFAIELAHRGVSQAAELTTVMFAIIIGTVAIYSLTAKPLARMLGLASPDAQGLLILGAHYWARLLAQTLHKRGVQVLLVDTNFDNIKDARLMGLPAVAGNILSNHFLEELDLAGLGRLLAITSNNEVNSLAALKLSELFGKENVYQIAPFSDFKDDKEDVPLEYRGRMLFGSDLTYVRISRAFSTGAEIKVTPLTREFNYEGYQKMHGNQAIPMFTLDENERLLIFSADKRIDPPVGTFLISAVGGIGPEELQKESHASQSPQDAL